MYRVRGRLCACIQLVAFRKYHHDGGGGYSGYPDAYPQGAPYGVLIRGLFSLSEAQGILEGISTQLITVRSCRLVTWGCRSGPA